MFTTKHIHLLLTAVIMALSAQFSAAAVLTEAVPEIKIPLARKPTSHPMTVAYVPQFKRYYVADGGLAPIPGDPTGAPSRSEVHVYDAEGHYLASARPGLDNRSIYYNEQTQQLESITYNVSAYDGFGQKTGVFALPLEPDGALRNDSDEIAGQNPAFGNSSTIPSYDATHNVYYAKQERSNIVRVVAPGKREVQREIKLELDAIPVKMDEIAHYFVAYTGIDGAELALLDVEHKAILVFDLNGKFVARSALPAALKLRSQNHISGTGFCNRLFFVYVEPEGEFGTYYGFRFIE